MSYKDFQRQYDQESDKLYNKLNDLAEDELLRLITDPDEDRYKIRTGGDNSVVWRVLGEKGTRKSIRPLFGLVSDLNLPYLIRYHACGALFKIAGLNDDDLKGQVQYGLDKNRQRVDQGAAIERLGGLVGI